LTRISILFAATALLSCSGAPKHTETPPPAGAATGAMAGSAVDPEPTATASIPDTQLGLSKTSVFDTPDPPAFAYPTAEPGGNPKLARPFHGAPPLIPHQVADFLPISIGENGCLACHELGETTSPDDPPALPPSHGTDFRAAPDEVGDSPVGARWRCVACHLPQSDAPPLVGNSFEP